MKFLPKSDEQTFLLGALCSFIQGVTPFEIPDHINWNRLNRLKALGYFEPIMYYLYGQHQKIPAELNNSWKKALFFTLLRNQQALEASVKLFEILETHGIPAVLMRGMALINTTYPEAYLRPMYDVDLLVPKLFAKDISRYLAEKGLHPVKKLRSQLVYQLGTITFEIHWQFLTPYRYQKATDFESWICARRLLPVPEGNLFVLRTEHELIGLICHAFIHHELCSFHSLLDIGLFVSQHSIDWEQIAKCCQKAAISRLVKFSLAFVDHLFDLDFEYERKCIQASLPAQTEKIFEAYSTRLFGEENHLHYLRRKLNLVYVAERKSVKLRQIIRLMGAGEWFPFLIMLRNYLSGNPKSNRRP